MPSTLTDMRCDDLSICTTDAGARRRQRQSNQDRRNRKHQPREPAT